MAGSSIFEYIHSHDHKELAEQLGLNQPKPGSSFYAPLGSDSSDEGSSTPNPPRSSTPSLSERGANAPFWRHRSRSSLAFCKEARDSPVFGSLSRENSEVTRDAHLSPFLPIIRSIIIIIIII